MNSYNGFTHQQRMAGFRWLNDEIAEGRRPECKLCESCGQDQGVIAWHSEDYSEPHGDHIGAFGLCYACHMMLHCRFKSPERFKQYTEAVEAGARFMAFPGKHWGTFKSAFLSSSDIMRPWQRMEAPRRPLLADMARLGVECPSMAAWGAEHSTSTEESEDATTGP